MSDPSKKDKSTNKPEQQIAWDEVTNKKNISQQNGDAVREVDDKLIGDDLNIQEAEEGYENRRDTPLKDEENNY